MNFRLLPPAQEWVPGGELFHHLDILGAFDEPTAVFFAANVLLSLSFLHSKVRRGKGRQRGEGRERVWAGRQAEARRV